MINRQEHAIHLTSHLGKLLQRWRSPTAATLTIVFIAAVLIAVGVRLAQLPALGASFAGAFLTLTGLQIALWVFGIRMELLGNAAEPVTEDQGPTDPLRRSIMHVLEVIRRAERELARAPVDKRRLDQVHELASKLISNGLTDPSVAVMLLSMEIEKAAHVYFGAEYPSPESRAARLDPFEGRGDIFGELACAYYAFWDLRNSVVYGQIAMPDAATVYEIIDIATRLLRLLSTERPSGAPNQALQPRPPNQR